ncbi:MAG: hypothetical protein JJE39_16460 [Vicinamibacteria bacterium]|nr:hypothetical protein [Vicinamibacteria bacterium]
MGPKRRNAPQPVVGTLYFVMGDVKGESLAARLKREGRLPVEVDQTRGNSGSRGEYRAVLSGEARGEPHLVTSGRPGQALRGLPLRRDPQALLARARDGHEAPIVALERMLDEGDRRAIA